MTPLTALEQVRNAQSTSGRPLAIVLAGHNGSGKSTMWRKMLADRLQMPLINADRMMLSILPEPSDTTGALVQWAQDIRDNNNDWMSVAQRGVEGFVTHAMAAKVPFALETVFSDWRPLGGDKFASKIDRIRELQEAGYFVLLIFVGLAKVDLSIMRVQSRVQANGHDVPADKLAARFPRTQKAIALAINVADAALLADNSRDESLAFTICRVQVGTKELFDVRAQTEPVPQTTSDWLDVVCPRE